jgi:hypothetical protein
MIFEEIEILGSKMIKKTTIDGREYWIPPDPDNSDYQEYLASLEEDLV